MLIMGIHQVPSLTQERYEEVVRRLTNGEGRLESISDLPFEGLLVLLPDKARKASTLSTSSNPRRQSTISTRRWLRSQKRSVSKSHPCSSRHTPLSRLDPLVALVGGLLRTGLRRYAARARRRRPRRRLVMGGGGRCSPLRSSRSAT
jgi:hypothetical protein